ncbi:hypothetical protein AXA44_36660 [Rhodococcus sp. SC4]|nr:hypothetical protein AXA44_36660 [Rhodococcus sp. SC4]
MLLCLIGVVLVAAALATKFVLVPTLSKLPDGFSMSGLYVGSMESPNPDPTQAGATVTTPIEVDRQLTVEQVDGDAAVVTSFAEIYASPRGEGAEPLSVDRHSYAVDRTTFTQSAPPNGAVVEDQKGGVTFSLPPNPSTDGQMFYDSTTRTAQPMTFAGETTIEGRDAYRYLVDATGPVADPAVLQPIRAALGQKFGTDGTIAPKAVLAAMGLPAEDVAALPDSLPVGLAADNQVEFVVDREFGSPIQARQTVTITAAIGGADSVLPPMTLAKSTVQASDALVTTTVDSLNSNHMKLSLISVWLPLILGALGVALTAIGLVRIRKPAPAVNSSERVSSSDFSTRV